MNAKQVDKFRKQLLQAREQLLHAVNHVQDALSNNAAKTEISSIRTHLADMDSEGEDANLAVAQNEQEILDAVDGALGRMEDGTFGKCEDCGEPIAEDRLEALPYTPYCISCAERQQSLR